MRQPENFVETLVARSESRPENVAFAYIDEQGEMVSHLSNQQLHRRAAAIAAKLQSISSPAERILLLFPQGLAFITAFMGAIYSSTIPVTTAPPWDNEAGNKDDGAIKSDIKQIIEATDVKIVLTTTSILNDVVQYFFKSKVLSEKLFISVEDITDDLADTWSMPPIDNHCPAYLQRSAAANRLSKLVTLSHENLMCTQKRIQEVFKLDVSSVSVNWLPHYHYLGLTFGILQPLYSGFSSLIYSKFDFFRNPHSWLNAITKHKATFSGAPDFAYRMCVDQIPANQRSSLALSSWNTAYNSGETINTDTLERFIDQFRDCGLRESALTPMYGLAESVYVTSSKFCRSPHQSMRYVLNKSSMRNDRNEEVVNSVSCGISSARSQVMIVNPNSRTRCKDLELGEIWVKSECSAIEYWDSPEQTAMYFDVYLDDAVGGPYLRTGDLGFMAKGEVHVVGKLRNDGEEAILPRNIA